MTAALFGLAALSSAIIMTESGAVRGECSGPVCSFKHIPYAAAPVGDLRWRPPQPPVAWEGERDATQFGPQCRQVDTSGNVVGSEDCLQLNVFKPSEDRDELRPVLFWIHGGSHVSGSGRTDGTRLVQRTGVVLVAINYRLGPLGYLAHPALLAEGTTGGYGMLDQIAALQWVQRNIERFGGDPNRVTIFGQSAGSISVCGIVASPLARGLFAGAIMQSGGCGALTLENAQTLGRAIFNTLGCWDAECMRSRSVEDVLTATRRPDYYGPGSAYAATIDGYVLRGLPENVIARGEHNRVPAIIGCTSDEESRMAIEIANEREYRQAIWNMIPVPGADTLILREYPPHEYTSYKAAYVAAQSDRKYVCSSRRAARAFLVGQSQPVWRFVFTHALDNATPEVQAQGAWHGADVMYVFDTLDRGGYIASEAERMLVEVFSGYWSRMAETGEPSRADLPLWPQYDSEDTYLRIDSIVEPQQQYRKRQCDFWDDLPSKRPAASFSPAAESIP